MPTIGGIPQNHRQKFNVQSKRLLSTLAFYEANALAQNRTATDHGTALAQNHISTDHVTG
jgi:hypothetical protein